MWDEYRSIPLVCRIFVAFVAGSAVGILSGERVAMVSSLGKLFIRLLNMLIIPIVVFTLFSGIRQLSPVQLGKIGGLVVEPYAVTMTIADLIGLAAANILRPGRGVGFLDAEARS